MKALWELVVSVFCVEFTILCWKQELEIDFYLNMNSSVHKLPKFKQNEIGGSLLFQSVSMF